MDDSERRVRTELIGVLNDFALPFTETHTKKHPAIMFDVAGKHLTYTYSGGDPRNHLNARSDLRRLILQAGGQLPISTVLPEKLTLPGVNDFSMPEVTEESAPKALEDVKSNYVQVLDPEEVLSTVTVTVEPVVEPFPPGPPRRVKEIMPNAVYQAKRLVPNECLVIEITKDMLLEHGSVVIIPLHKPELISMPRDLFDASFSVMLAEVAPPPLPVIPPVEEKLPTPLPVKVDEPHIPEPVWEPPVVQKSLVAPEPVIERIPEGVSAMKKPRQTNIKYTPYREITPRSIGGVSPQLGRILAAMMYKSDTTHHTELEPSDLHDVLAEHDQKQFSARMRVALYLGFAERGQSLPGRTGWYVKITKEGRKFVTQKLKTWPWLYDGQDVPPWASR